MQKIRSLIDQYLSQKGSLYAHFPAPTWGQTTKFLGDRPLFTSIIEAIERILSPIRWRGHPRNKTCDARQSKHFVGVAGKIPVIFKQV